MALEHTPIDLKDAPSLPELVDEVRRTNRSRVIRADGEDVAMLVPAPKKPATRRPRKGAFTRDDPLWTVVGIGRSGVTDVSSNKKKYLAEAYLAEYRKV